MNKIFFLLSIHQTLLMATCHFLWQASTIVYFTMLLLAMKEIHNERHYKNNFFFIKWMINTLCNMFSSKFGEKIKYVEATWVFLGKKKVPFEYDYTHAINFFLSGHANILWSVVCMVPSSSSCARGEGLVQTMVRWNIHMFIYPKKIV
jgi:hypothetical protein